MSDRLMSMKFETEGLKVISKYAPLLRREMETKDDSWNELDKVEERIPKEERVLTGRDLDGHVGEGNAVMRR